MSEGDKFGMPNSWPTKSGKVDREKKTAEVVNFTCSNCSNTVQAGEASCNGCGWTLIWPEANK